MVTEERKNDLNPDNSTFIQGLLEYKKILANHNKMETTEYALVSQLLELTAIREDAGKVDAAVNNKAYNQDKMGWTRLYTSRTNQTLESIRRHNNCEYDIILLLADLMDTHNKISIATRDLAGELDISKLNTITKALKRLQSYGCIHIMPGSGKQASIYTVNPCIAYKAKDIYRKAAVYNFFKILEPAQIAGYITIAQPINVIGTRIIQDKYSYPNSETGEIMEMYYGRKMPDPDNGLKAVDYAETSGINIAKELLGKQLESLFCENKLTVELINTLDVILGASIIVQVIKNEELLEYYKNNSLAYDFAIRQADKKSCQSDTSAPATNQINTAPTCTDTSLNVNNFHENDNTYAQKNQENVLNDIMGVDIEKDQLNISDWFNEVEKIGGADDEERTDC